MLTRKQLLAGGLTGAAGFVASGALGGGKGHGWGTTHKLGRTTTTSAGGLTYPAGVIPHLATIVLGSELSIQTNMNKYDLLGLGQDFVVTSPAKKITYGSGSQTYDGIKLFPGYPNNITYARANGYLLHNSVNAEIPYAGSAFLTDPGNVSYQNDVKAAVRSYLSGDPSMVGLYFDNFTTDALKFTSSATYPLKDAGGVVLYNAAADYENAQLAFSNNVHVALKGDGYYVGVNAATGSGGEQPIPSQTWLSRYHANVTAVMMEYWLQPSGRSTVVGLQDGISDNSWNDWTGVHRLANSYGVGFIGLAAGDWRLSSWDTSARYHIASFLMDWNGVPVTSQTQGTGAATFWAEAVVDNWSPNIFSIDLGLPVAARTALTTADGHGAQVWARQLSKGYAIVNPTVTSQSVTFAGTPYTIASGDAVLTVT